MADCQHRQLHQTVLYLHRDLDQATSLAAVGIVHRIFLQSQEARVFRAIRAITERGI